MRRAEIDPFYCQMVSCSASHDHVCINYLVVMCPTIVGVPRVSFHTGSTHKIIATFSECCIFQHKAKNAPDVLVKCIIAGETAKCGISQVIAGRLTPMRTSQSHQIGNIDKAPFQQSLIVNVPENILITATIVVDPIYYSNRLIESSLA